MKKKRKRRAFLAFGDPLPFMYAFIYGQKARGGGVEEWRSVEEWRGLLLQGWKGGVYGGAGI